MSTVFHHRNVKIYVSITKKTYWPGKFFIKPPKTVLKTPILNLRTVKITQTRKLGDREKNGYTVTEIEK